MEIISDGALLIRDGLLQEVGPSRRVENLTEARRAIEINAAGRVVLPGFIDSHTHLVLPPPAAPGPQRYAAARAIQDQTAARLAMRVKTQLDSMARHGTTTVEVKCAADLDRKVETKALRVLRDVHRKPLDVVPSILISLARALDAGPDCLEDASHWLVRQFLPRIWKRRLARFVDFCWNDDPRARARLQDIMRSAHQIGFACRVHGEAADPAGAIQLAAAEQALSIDHLESALEADLSLLRGSAAMVTLLPAEPFIKGRGTASARDLIESGAPLVLGSDYNAHCTPVLSMQSVIAMSCMRMGLTPAEAISASTFNAAHALGLATTVGSFEAGKSADVIMLNTRDYRDLGEHLGTNLVHTTIKRGEIIYRESEVMRSGDQSLPSPEEVLQ